MCGPQSEPIGQIFPGRGLYLDRDLKSLGILRRIPHVYQRTSVQKLVAAFKSERQALRLIATRDRALGYGDVGGDLARAAITTYDGIISARAGGYANDFFVAKASITTIAATWYSLMQAAAGTVAAISGLAAGSATANSGGSVCTRATTGAWSVGATNVSAGQSKYLLTFGYTAAQAIDVLCLIDILVGVSGISRASTTNTVNTVALTRYTNGVGVWPVLEVTVAAGSGAFNGAGTYTNQAGTASLAFQATAAFPSAPVSRIQQKANGVPFPAISLAAGDYGVQVVTTITVSAASTGTATSFSSSVRSRSFPASRPTLSLQDGQPFTIYCAIYTAAGDGYDALLVPGQGINSGPHNVNQWLNPAAFTNPPLATAVGQSNLAPLGGAPAQAIGPGFHRLDLSLFKQFQSSDSTHFEFRAEVFNLTNHPNLWVPFSQLDFEQPQFTQITQTRDTPNDPSEIQLALKFYW